MEDGYRRVRVAPCVSRTLGPSRLNASVRTPAGNVTVQWVRGAAPRQQRPGGSVLVLRVGVPVTIQAEVAVPLLVDEAHLVQVAERGRGATVWNGTHATAHPKHGILAASIDMDLVRGLRLLLNVSMGIFELQVYGGAGSERPL